MATKPYFSRVWVTPYSTGGVAVQWRLNPACGLSGSSFSFHVYRGVSGGEWERLTSTPIVDDVIYVDESLPIQHSTRIVDGWYMVSVLDGSTELESDPVPLTGQLSALEWRLIREQTRAHARLTETYCGIPGWLFRKKNSGTRCTCFDTDLASTADSTCASCYGTGWLGGFHTALDFTLIPTARGTDKVTQTPVEGSVRDDTIQFLCQAIPQVHSGDIWMHGVTGDHYEIIDSKVAKAFRGVPIVLNLVLTPVSAGDVTDNLMPTDYTAPDWTGELDTSALATITFSVDEDMDIDYEGYDPDESGTAVDMNDVTPVFEIFDDLGAMNDGEAALLTITLTATANDSVWSVLNTDKLHLYMSLEDVIALGAGSHYYRTMFTYNSSAEVIEHGPLTIEAS